MCVFLGNVEQLAFQKKRSPDSYIALANFPDRTFLPWQFYYVFIYVFWLCWVFVALRGLSLIAASRAYMVLTPGEAITKNRTGCLMGIEVPTSFMPALDLSCGTWDP